MSASINSNFHSPNQNVRYSLVTQIFGQEPTRRNVSALGEYFDFFAAEIARLRFAVNSRQLNMQSMTIKTFADFALITRILLKERGSSRKHIRSIICSEIGENETDDSLNHSINLTLCLMTMMNVREAGFRLQTLQTPVLSWDDHSKLEDFIAKHFPTTALSMSPRDGRLDPDFTASNMVNICGLKIE